MKTKNNLVLASGLWVDYSVVNGKGLTPQEKLLFSMIWELSKRAEGCTASNKYFMAHLEMPSEQSVSEAIKRLKDKDMIRSRVVHYQKGSKRYLMPSMRIKREFNETLDQDLTNYEHTSQNTSGDLTNYGADIIDDNIDGENSGSLRSLEENLDKSRFSLEQDSQKSKPEKEEKIPFDELKALFKGKHKEFRKTDIFWEARKQKPNIRRLWQVLGTKDKIEEAIEALIGYLKNCKDQFGKTMPILPTSLSGAMLNQILPYWPGQSTRPKLEIKQYENKGVYIGPMPEGW